MNYVFVCLFSLFLAVSTFFAVLLLSCLTVYCFVNDLCWFCCCGCFSFFVSSHSSTPDLEMTGKESDAFIESVFDSLYKKCHPISLNVVLPKVVAQYDRAL